MVAKLKRWFKRPYKVPAISALVVSTFVAAQLFVLAPIQPVLASQLLNRSLQVINPVPSATTEYQFNFDITTSATIGSVLFEFCSNSPVFGASCTAPAGFSASSASLASQNGAQGFATVPGQPANRILLSRIPALVNAPVSASYVFDNIQNAANTGSSYVRVSTYTDNAAAGSAIDEGGIAYAITNALDISTEVPPYLEFCTGVDIFGFTCAGASGDSLDFGEFSSHATSAATSQFMAATNAGFGYNITLDGTTLTSGNNTIPAASGGGSVVGVGQFGLNLRANSVPSIGSDPQGPGTSTTSSNYAQPDHYRFSSGDILVSSVSSDNFHKFTVSYVVNVPASQPPGDYSATMFYICLANF